MEDMQLMFLEYFKFLKFEDCLLIEEINQT